MYDDRIDKRFDRTHHIPLRCKNHPELTGWSTKNIGGSIFYSGQQPECDCPFSALRILTDEEYAMLHK